MDKRTEQSVAPSPARRPRNRSQRQLDESAELKAEIVRTAARAFAERGYAQTTLDVVAKLVGLSRQGVLHHFPSKDALFAAVLDREKGWAQARAAIESTGAGLDAIHGLAVFLGHHEDSRVPLQLIHVLEGEGIAGNEAARRYVVDRAAQVRGEIRRRLDAGRDGGAIAANADLDAATLLIAATINGLQKLWLLDPALPTEIPFDLLLQLLEPYLTGSPAETADQERAPGGG
ncbi:AcrR family transcriptional regulator [Catenuloplanes nepalensis]|uniref:AcrR family transcriptional regulator n=1 Tax=Catenuloplanes nepalensis TaxID=587533 RepID=A0ABT9MNQ3_9ACTN|nr:TetR/AcrR family transcriptional regulator [Catenuloplanes nepalensis]MDP9793032.1 AcrR family transcriptional regulator [Catenuloplanes nepalensis]